MTKLSTAVTRNAEGKKSRNGDGRR